MVDGIRKAIDEIQTETDPLSGISKEELLSDSMFQQGNILIMLGQLDMAIEAYSDAIDLNLDFAAVYNNRGVAYGKKGEFNKAITDFDKAIQFKSDFTNAYYNRGSAYREKGELHKAIKNLSKVIELDPDCVDAYYNRGVTYTASWQV